MFTHVYIGNVEASITEQQLEDHFATCGSIRKTILRLSRGQAITVGVAIPKARRTSRDLKYASMEFYSSKSALNALKLHGSMLEGVKLVVCAAAGDLPEVADIARPRIQNIRLKEQLAARPAPRVRALRAPKPLVRNDTEADFSDPKNDRIRIFGYSFDKCIM
ncbi:hypothetical protein BJ912DRAFT_264548 [Pholiota molesta]|nr:hypothetical protein BJ912DRAFT_264548 [Pholiota molesta]